MGGTPGGRGHGQAHPLWLLLPASQTALGLLSLGSPAGVGIPFAQASLGVPAFLGFCLAFLSMWTCPKQAKSEGWVTLQATQRHLGPFHKRGRSGGPVIAVCGGGSSLVLPSGSPAPRGPRGSSPCEAGAPEGPAGLPGAGEGHCSRTSAAPLRPACLAPPLTYLWAHGRYDNVSGSLDPGLAINLHRCGLEEGDAEVGALGNADARAQPALDLALVRGEPAGLSGRQGHAGPRPPACLRSPCA